MPLEANPGAGKRQYRTDDLETATYHFILNARRFTPRLKAAAARYGQPVPRVRFPDEY